MSVAPYAVNMCNQALDIMSKSIDPMHDLSHVLRILDMYQFYIKDKPNSRANHNHMLLAICWHDVWKARRSPKNIFAFLYDQVAEGILTSKIFAREFEKYSNDKATQKAVAYAIRKHSAFQIMKHKTFESRLLWDLDELDEWNFERVRQSKKDFFLARSKSMLIAFKVYMKLENGKSLHTTWAKNIFPSVRSKFFNSIDEEINLFSS